MIVLLSTSDTDLLSARASGAGYRLANPARLAAEDLPPLLAGATAVVVRILGGRQAWEDGLDAVAASEVPMIVLGGEVTPDAELMQLSTVAAGVVAEAHAYLAHGGPDNLLQLARFLSDAIALTGEGFEPPAATPTWGILERPEKPPEKRPEKRPESRHQTDPSSPSCTTAPITWRAIPTSCTLSPTRSRRRAGSRCRCSAPRCARPNPR